MKKFSHIIPEEEIDVNDEIYRLKSPFMGGMLEGNKISAIGMHITDGRKDSPFWDADYVNEFQNSMNPKAQT